MRQLPRLALTLATLLLPVPLVLLSTLLTVDVRAGGIEGDAWGVRLSGKTLETLSEVNTGKPARGKPVAAQALDSRRRGKVSIQLLADTTTASRLGASAKPYGPELDKALEWMHRLRPAQHRRARIVLTLVDSHQHTTVRRMHDASDETVVDLLVAIPSTGSTSSAVGKALGVALHELSHAYSIGAISGKVLGRRDDEYRASLVESCYLIDTMRVGDTLKLAPRRGADGGEYFVTAQSRDASRDAVKDLVRAAGTDTVPWNDNIALLGLKLGCGVRLAQP